MAERQRGGEKAEGEMWQILKGGLCIGKQEVCRICVSESRRHVHLQRFLWQVSGSEAQLSESLSDVAASAWAAL